MPSDRLRDFPSCTWVGWSGELTFDNLIEMRPSLRKISILRQSNEMTLRYTVFGDLCADRTGGPFNDSPDPPLPTARGGPSVQMGDAIWEFISEDPKDIRLRFEARLV